MARKHSYAPAGALRSASYAHLTSAQSWFVKTNAPRGMRHFNRRNVSFKEDNAFSTGNARFKADERYSFGWTDPRGMFGSVGV